LRYSATHRNPYNLVYRLDPVRAFELKLVKQIVVASAKTDQSANDAYIFVEKVEYKPRIQARLRLHMQGHDGPRIKTITVRNGADLYALSNERANYRDGFSIAEISAEPGNEYIRFSNGRVLHQGEEIGGAREDVWKVQIKHTIKRHLDKELQVRARGIKVLSLFFVDRVANYRDYDANGRPVKGKFALEFEEALTELAQEPRYAGLEWLRQPIEKLHDGYFAQDKKGAYKDTRGDTQADDEVYNKIMRNKEQLLSNDEPLCFIFSHSALREGWDNPNVFQICTLNETQSAMKKRQEIGRGLRLPVDQNGLRVRDESINKLYVMANESYEEFAKKLQEEYEEDCGVTFGKVPLTALAKIIHVVDGLEKPIGRETAEELRSALVAQKMLDVDGRIQPAFDPQRPGFELNLPETHQELAPAVIDLLCSYQIERHIRKDKDEGPNRLKKQVQLSPEFQALWDCIKPKTTYRVEFSTADLVNQAVIALKRMEKVEVPTIDILTGQVGVTKAGVTATPIMVAEEKLSYGTRPMPDLLAYLQNETELTRSTLVRILKESGKLGEFFNDPQRFMDAVARVIKYELHRLLVDGIKYERIPGTGLDIEWEMMLFKNEEMINYLTALQVNKSVYEYVVYESEIEREFAQKLDQREDIRLFVKLPGWFQIDTPLGTYNPDWAIMKENDHTLYLVRETKGTRNFLQLRTTEADKIRCGQKHFEALDVSFDVVISADEV
jgi:type III restriction enzyme